MQAFDQARTHRHRLSTGGSEKLQLTALLGTTKGSVQLASMAMPAKITK
jgi:hypothetical protein